MEGGVAERGTPKPGRTLTNGTAALGRVPVRIRQDRVDVV